MPIRSHSTKDVTIFGKSLRNDLQIRLSNILIKHLFLIPLWALLLLYPHFYYFIHAFTTLSMFLLPYPRFYYFIRVFTIISTFLHLYPAFYYFVNVFTPCPRFYYFFSTIILLHEDVFTTLIIMLLRNLTSTFSRKI